MSNSSWQGKIADMWSQGRFLCVGLDPDKDRVPYPHIPGSHHNTLAERDLAFCKKIVDVTNPFAGAYKPNAAFFERLGVSGHNAQQELITHIRTVAPDVPIIWDAKRADIGKTNEGYVEALLQLGADAITINPYFGQEAVIPFLNLKDKGIIILCRTSNKGAGEFQDRSVEVSAREMEEFGEKGIRTYMPMYQFVAYRVSRIWNKTHGNCALVVGATAPDELRKVREIVGDTIPILAPGIGTQGGDLEATVRNGLTRNRDGLYINASSSILYASNDAGYAEAARAEALRLHKEIGVILSHIAVHDVI